MAGYGAVATRILQIVVNKLDARRTLFQFVIETKREEGYLAKY
jgi:hypothetical protein